MILLCIVALLGGGGGSARPALADGKELERWRAKFVLAQGLVQSARQGDPAQPEAIVKHLAEQLPDPRKVTGATHDLLQQAMELRRVVGDRRDEGAWIKIHDWCLCLPQDGQDVATLRQEHALGRAESLLLGSSDLFCCPSLAQLVIRDRVANAILSDEALLKRLATAPWVSFGLEGEECPAHDAISELRLTGWGKEESDKDVPISELLGEINSRGCEMDPAIQRLESAARTLAQMQPKDSASQERLVSLLLRLYERLDRTGGSLTGLEAVVSIKRCAVHATKPERSGIELGSIQGDWKLNVLGAQGWKALAVKGAPMYWLHPRLRYYIQMGSTKILLPQEDSSFGVFVPDKCPAGYVGIIDSKNHGRVDWISERHLTEEGIRALFDRISDSVELFETSPDIAADGMIRNGSALWAVWKSHAAEGVAALPRAEAWKGFRLMVEDDCTPILFETSPAGDCFLHDRLTTESEPPR